MAELDSDVEIYRLHVLLRDVYPPVWRRLLVYSGTSVADLHDVIQIAFDWSDAHLHRFRIRGRQYGIGRVGGITFTRDAHAIRLAEFRFRLNERFRYEYDFGDGWQHQIRFEGTAPLVARKAYRACVGGAGTAPPEDCGGPDAYAALLDEYRQNPPLEELQLMADTVQRILKAQDDETVGPVVGDLDALARAVDRVKAYHDFQPDRLDRRRINRRLRQYAGGDERWRTE